MKLSELPYPVRLAVEMLSYATRSSEKARNTKYNDIRAGLGAFFPEEVLADAERIMCGEGLEAEQNNSSTN